jgi:hypothetical protein
MQHNKRSSTLNSLLGLSALAAFGIWMYRKPRLRKQLRKARSGSDIAGAFGSALREDFDSAVDMARMNVNQDRLRAIAERTGRRLRDRADKGRRVLRREVKELRSIASKEADRLRSIVDEEADRLRDAAAEERARLEAEMR